MSSFYKSPYFPAFDKLEATHAKADFDKLIEDAYQAVAEVEANLNNSCESLFTAIYEACSPLYHAWNLLGHMLSVMNNSAWRKAHEEIQPEIVAFSLRVIQSEPIYNEMLRLQKSDNKHNKFNKTQRRILDTSIRGAQQSGVGLPTEQQSHFNEIQRKLSALSTAFQNNLLDATKSFSLLLKSADDIKGLPHSLLAVTAQAAADDKDIVHVPGQDGSWKITLDTAVYIPFMKHSENRQARETMYRAYVTRASSDPLDNTPLISAILELRQEMAALLGFSSYAELSLAAKSARSVSAVDTLTDELQQAARAPALQEMEQLEVFARSHGFTDNRLQPWDIAYWLERQREELFDYNEEELSHYFPFPQVLEGMFKLAERLFGIKIAEKEGTVPTWHPDVRFFQVYNESDNKIACFYLDPYSRPATKSGGAWMNHFHTRKRDANCNLVLPMAVLVCNQSVPVGDTPPCMRFDEILTLFHEFGHALQHMLTEVDNPNVSGINGIEWDAIEIVSQFMENWCYDRATIKNLSSHVKTQEQLPDELFDKIVNAKNHFAANAMLRQLFLSATDMDLHARYPKAGWDSPDDVKVENSRKFLATPPLLEEDSFLASFAHIFAGGYAAGYYSYKWSEVSSADAFALFEERDLTQEEAVQQTGREFRQTFLALGGSLDPSEVFQLFRERQPSITPLLRHAGLIRK